MNQIWPYLYAKIYENAMIFESLNSSHASSRDMKHASERDFRGGGLATDRHGFLFLSSFPFKLRVITLYFKIIPIGICYRITYNYTVITLYLWYIARATQWSDIAIAIYCTRYILKLHCNYTGTVIQWTRYIVVTLQLYCNCDTLHVVHIEDVL